MKYLNKQDRKALLGIVQKRVEYHLDMSQKMRSVLKDEGVYPFQDKLDELQGLINKLQN